jgi:hypothetical protein
MIRTLMLFAGGLIAIGLANCSGSTGRLAIAYDDGAGTVQEWTLTCDPPAGSHPDPEAACRALAEHGATALPPVPDDQPCTMIYGGPQTARVTGSWNGAAVDSTLSRTNGCEIARWRALRGLLPPS